MRQQHRAPVDLGGSGTIAVGVWVDDRVVRMVGWGVVGLVVVAVMAGVLLAGGLLAVLVEDDLGENILCFVEVRKVEVWRVACRR